MDGVEKQQDEIEVFGRSFGGEDLVLLAIFGLLFEALLRYRGALHDVETTRGK